MPIPPVYQSGEEIRKRDRILLHDEPGEVEFVLDGETNPEDWPASEFGRGVMIVEPKILGRLFLTENDLGDYEDLVFVSRSVDREAV
jgi:hypothetical protein